MLNPLKVATPFTVFIVVVPDRVAPLVPVPEVIAKVTQTEEVVTLLPYKSCIVTTGWVTKAIPAVLLELGWVVKASFTAAPITTLKLLLIAEVRVLLFTVKV